LGEWTYSMQAYEDDYIAKMPDIQIEEAPLSNDVRYVINRVASINKGKSKERPLVSYGIVDDFRQRIEQNPQKPLSKLSQQTGVYPAF
jgi:hypothetical protein